MHAFGDPSDGLAAIFLHYRGNDELEWTPETGSQFSTSDALAWSQSARRRPCAEFFLNASSCVATNPALRDEANRTMNSAV
jgi:hypothetical protein